MAIIGLSAACIKKQNKTWQKITNFNPYARGKKK